jgi:hypothetical protein
VARSLSTRGRFALAYLVLGAAVGAALGGFIVLAKRPAPKPGPPWSSWQPKSSSRDDQVLEIANHVGNSYRLASGDRLAKVKVGSPEGVELRAIAIPKKKQPQTLGDFRLYEQDKSVVYALCGNGSKNCYLPATLARAGVLRREALELALYTLKYAPVDNVLVFFPPGSRKTKPMLTVFLHRKELEGRLDHPLRTTLPQAKPPLPGQVMPLEQETVDALTRSSIYRYLETDTGPGYGNVLVVQPVS